MKTLSGLFLTLLSGSLNLYGAPSVGNQSSQVPSSTAYAVVSNDANSRIWQRETYETLPSGQIVTNFHSYTELASGLNYWDGQQWLPSKEEIDAYAGGAIAQYGQHKVIFANNLNSAGAIDLHKGVSNCLKLQG